MDYIEGEPTCHSCWIEFDHNDPFLLLCPRHAAADEMYEALETVKKHAGKAWAWEKVYDALALADGEAS